jgi:hypothetical protein
MRSAVLADSGVADVVVQGQACNADHAGEPQLIKAHLTIRCSVRPSNYLKWGATHSEIGDHPMSSQCYPPSAAFRSLCPPSSWAARADQLCIGDFKSPPPCLRLAGPTPGPGRARAGLGSSPVGPGPPGSLALSPGPSRGGGAGGPPQGLRTNLKGPWPLSRFLRARWKQPASDWRMLPGPNPTRCHSDARGHIAASSSS